MTDATHKNSLTHTFRRAVYAGSFSPITRGHHDIIMQAARTFDEVIVAVGINPGKMPLFTDAERVAMIEHDIKTHIAPALVAEGVKCNLLVASFNGTTARFMQANDAPFYVRGLCAGTEFDAEFASLMVSKNIYPAFTPVFFCSTNPKLQSVSSTIAREVCKFGEDQILGEYVTDHVKDKLIERMRAQKMRP
jgi:pantetheine-phosphate adenylyltransferase